MVKVDVYKQGNFGVSATKIKEIIKKTLLENGVVSDFAVSVALVSEKTMDELVRKYYQKDLHEKHPILTFPNSEMRESFVSPPSETNSLGDIIISYPQAVDEAKETNQLLDKIICDLAEHGTLHLLGLHH